MARWKSLLVFGLLACAVLVNAAEEKKAAAEEADDDDYAEEERAQLVVRKWIKESQVVQGRNLTIHLEVFNAGSSAATAVSIADAALPDGFELLEGAPKATFAKVDVGSKAAHSYVVSVKGAAGPVGFEPAAVTYKADADGEQQSATSTGAYVEVLTPTQQLQQYALTGGKYVSLGMMRTGRDWAFAAAFFGVAALALGGSSAFKSASTARAAQLRKRALAALEKDE